MTLKTFLLTGVVAGFSLTTFAQKSNVKLAVKELNNAENFSKKQDVAQTMLALARARAAIDSAVKDPSTKDDPQTWLTRANIFVSMQDKDSKGNDQPYMASYESLKKAFELSDKYKSKSEAIPTILNTAYFAFNDGVSHYNNSEYPDAYTALNKALFLLGPEGDSRFSAQKNVDTIRAQAKMIAGFSAYYGGQSQDAIPLLKDILSSKMIGNNTPNVYMVLAAAYDKAGDKDKQISTIEDGLKAFPDNENLKGAELNYYIASGNTNVLVSKFEAQIAKDPKNSMAQYNLGILYEQMASPSEGAAPANAAEYEQKAETAFNAALGIDPEDPKMNYQLGAFYFNKAADLNKKMNNMSDAQYKVALKQRDELFGKAIPLFEKAKSVYQPKMSSLKGDDLTFYGRSLQALSQIYAIQNKMDKANENEELFKQLPN